jgi:putative ABC transport system permease protein
MQPRFAAHARRLANAMSLRLSFWLARSVLLRRKTAAALSMLAIALGVALGFAIHLINQAALDDFNRAMQNLRGGADVTLSAANPQDGVPLTWIDALTQRAGVDAVSPIIETTVRVNELEQRVTLYGIDVFSGALLANTLLPRVFSGGRSEAVFNGGVFASPALLEALAKPERLVLQRTGAPVQALLAGDVPQAPAGRLLLVADIAWVQQMFGAGDRVSEIRIRLQQGTARTTWIAQQRAQLPPGLLLKTAEDEAARVSNLSRAYRVNLNVLALVALLTGGFLVFATQLTAVAQRGQTFALLGVVGLTPAARMRQVLVEALAIGVPGAVLGLVLGWGLALLLINTVGADLGGGYFSNQIVQLQVRTPAMLFFAAAGCLAALVGALYPAWLNRTQPLAQTLKTGFAAASTVRHLSWRLGLTIVLCALALGLAWLPAYAGLPVAGYVAIAVCLAAGIVATPLVGHALLSMIKPLKLSPSLRVAVQNAAQAPLMTQVAASGLMVSFALTVAMMLMVTSFRTAVDDWLNQVLPAPLYLRATSGAMPSVAWDELAQSGAFARIERTMRVPLVLDPARPAVDLLVREFDAREAAQTLPMTGPVIPAPAAQATSTTVWVTEAMERLYQARAGSTLTLPLAQPVTVWVGGVWRDYARQFGAVMMTAAGYRALGYSFSPSDAALWPVNEAQAQQVLASVVERHGGLEKSSAQEIRALSLRIFDRSFAVTYALEAAAIMIGLFGLAVTLAAGVELRKRELAMLAAMGFSLAALRRTVLAEGVAVTLIGLLVGCFCGIAIGAILIHVVNPQAFHWTMQMRMPWLVFAAAIALTFAASTMASVLAARRATRVPVATVLAQAQ